MRNEEKQIAINTINNVVVGLDDNSQIKTICTGWSLAKFLKFHILHSFAGAGAPARLALNVLVSKNKHLQK